MSNQSGSNSKQKHKLQRPRQDPINVRSYLNVAAKVANDIVETLAPITSSGGLLDKEQRENFRLATDTLKTVRELYLRHKAICSMKQEAAQTEVQPLSAIDAKVLLRLASKKDSAD
jgi:hypothetical protein